MPDDSRPRSRAYSDDKPKWSPRAEQPQPVAPLPLLWFEDIQPVLEAQDFVQGLLARGRAGVVYGESNAGKTFWTTDLALHVAAGKAWNGRRVDGGAVLYCCLEGANNFRNRASAWRADQGMEDARIPFAAITLPINLLDPEADTPRLIATARAVEARMGQPLALIVVDTLSRALAGGNENGPEDMGALVRNMDTMRTATGAFVLFVHHSGKDAAKGARGHSLLRAAIDTEIEVVADETSDGPKTATVVKQRDLLKGAAFPFHLEMVVMGQNEHGEDVTTCIVRADGAEAAKPKAPLLTDEERGWLRDLQAIFADPQTSTESLRPMKDMATMTCATRDHVRDCLITKGRIGVASGVALTATERSRLLRMLNRLKDKGKIGLTGEHVWLL